MLRQFATFYLGDNLYGIDVLLIREINQNIFITEVDPSPDYIVGLMNLRGQIVTIADLKVKLGVENEIDIIPGANCIVLKTDAELDRLRDEGLNVGTTSKDMVGLMVDKIGDMITVDEEEMEPPPANVFGVDCYYIKGVIKLDRQLLVVLNINNVLSMENMYGK
ncbi:Positive regulator of CheA protein activity (CheW) [Chitinispirillum alkaliphilum]|nr:Positive regulator of CheA protein activity (CheW) [Chitinispirillum alkaliphilum]